MLYLVVGVLLQALGCLCVGSLPFYTTTGDDIYAPPPVPSHTEAYFLPTHPQPSQHQDLQLTSQHQDLHLPNQHQDLQLTPQHQDLHLPTQHHDLQLPPEAYYHPQPEQDIQQIYYPQREVEIPAQQPYYPPVYSAVKASYAIPPHRDHNHLHDDYSDDGSQYEFSYEIRDGSQGQEFGHRETRYGNEVRGSYSVVLPDGRRQIVEYTAGPSGYHPVIRYEPAY